MSVIGSIEESAAPATPAEQFRQRCAELSIPAWWCDGTGRIASEPEAAGMLAQWLRSPALCTKVEAATRAHTDLEPAAVAIFAGCWLLMFPQYTRATRTGTTVALALEHRAVEAAAFAECCVAAGLDAEGVRRELEPLLHRDEADVRRTMRVLQWSHHDLLQASNDKLTLDQFCEKLAQAYEETDMLFKLARLLNCESEPAHIMATVCEHVHEILPFRWLAIRFGDQSRRVPDLAGRLVMAGETSIPRQALDAQLKRILSDWSSDGIARVLCPQHDPLAEMINAEVVAHLIAHNGQAIGVLAAGNKGGPDPDVSSAKLKFLDAAADFLALFHENLLRFTEQRALFVGTLRALTASIDAKDRYTCGHSERVALLASKLAIAMGLEKPQIEQFHIAGLVHDVGKIGVPEAVLCKRTRLTDEEFKIIRRHPNIGYEILKDIPMLAEMLPGVLHHHERWDGRGYPGGLRGEEIPLIARALTVADAFDSMSSNRSYRAALPRDQIFAEIRRCAGSQFDPAIAELFVTLDLTEYDALLARHQTQAQLAA